MKEPVAVSEYRLLAKRKLPKKIFDFIDAGACDEITKRNNREAFDTIFLKPLCLRDVSLIDTSINLLGDKISSPILIAPTAFHQLVHKHGEVSTAKAAKSCQIPMVVSSMSNRSLEDIASASMNNHLWLQIYIFKNRELTEALIHRAEKTGYKAIVVSVGTPVTGKRDRDVRNEFTLPPGLSTGNFNSTVNNEVIYHFTAHEFDPSLTWQDIEWVKSITTLPIILKGILNPIDAENACQLGVSGIVVSNHGGRQLDTAQATISALPDIVKTVAQRIKVFMDGGITRGTDIFKAIALGADAILIGRPVLWALALQGEKGVETMLNILKDEFEITMKLTGCHHIQEIKNFNINLGYVGSK